MPVFLCPDPLVHPPRPLELPFCTFQSSYKVLRRLLWVWQAWEHPFSNKYFKIYMKMKVVQSCPTLCDSMDYTFRGIQFMEFSRQEYWNGWLFPSPGDLPNPGIKPRSPTLQVDSLPATWEAQNIYIVCIYILYIYIYLVVPGLSHSMWDLVP